MLIEIKNDNLTVQIKSFGAELHSVKDNEGVEYIWYGDAKYWPRQAPILFPCVGDLVDNTAIINGNKHEILIHGFIRDYEFTTVTKTENSVTLECNYNEETLKRFPFKFSFQTTYTLTGNELAQSFCIKNLSDETMPFGLGGHTGFNCPLLDGEKFSDYKVEFIKNDTKLEAQIPENHRDIISSEQDFDLSYDKFVNGAFIYENLESNALKLFNPKTNRGVKVSYLGFPLLGIWTPNDIDSPFICIEPWLGMTDKKSATPIDINDHPMFAKLAPTEYAVREYTITFM